jgi:hypothetical protein
MPSRKKTAPHKRSSRSVMPDPTETCFGAEHVLADVAGGDVPIPLTELPAHPTVPKKRAKRPHIAVVSVVQSGSNLAWTFTAAVTLTGSNVPELENDFDGTGSWQSPDSCIQGSATSIVATYAGMPSELTPWRIASAPSNVSQSASITVPQSGTIAWCGIAHRQCRRTHVHAARPFARASMSATFAASAAARSSHASTRRGNSDTRSAKSSRAALSYACAATISSPNNPNLRPTPASWMWARRPSLVSCLSRSQTSTDASR